MSNDPNDPHQPPDWWPIHPEHHAVDDPPQVQYEPPEQVHYGSTPEVDATEFIPEAPIHELPSDEQVKLTADLPDEDEKNRLILVYIVAAAISVLLAALSISLYGQIGRWLPAWTLFIFLLVPVIFAAVWARGTIITQRQHQPTQARLNLPQDRDFIWINDRSLRRILYVAIVAENFEEASDNAIRLATRKKKWSLIKTWVVPLLISVTAVVVSALGGVHWSWPLLVCLLAASRMYWTYIQWVSWHLLATNIRLWIAISPPSYLWFLRKKRYPLLYRKIESCSAESQSVLGNLTGYGKVNVDAIGKADDTTFNDLKYIPRYEEVADLINLLKDQSTLEES